MNETFWSEHDRWPRDPAGYLFLARAFHKIGQARFGKAWSGNEPFAELEEFELPGGEVVYINLTDELETVKATVERRIKVVEFLIEQLEAGALHSAFRDPETGLMQPIPFNHWNFDGATRRFSNCKMDPNKPFPSSYEEIRLEDYNLWESKQHYIFIERTGLETILSSQQFLVAPQTFDGHLSPYIKLMLHVITQWDIHPKHQPAKAALEEMLRERWTGLEPLSDRLVQAMATLIREPESQAGRAKKRSEN